MKDSAYIIVPGDPDQWWYLPTMPSAPMATIEAAVSQALGAAWRSASVMAEPTEQPELQRPVDIVIDGLLGKPGSTPVTKPDQERLGKALDHASKPLSGRPGADAGVGRAINNRPPG